MHKDKNNIKVGGILAYDADLDYFWIENWVMEKLPGIDIYDEVVSEMIKALRRNLSRHRKVREGF